MDVCISPGAIGIVTTLMGGLLAGMGAVFGLYTRVQNERLADRDRQIVEKDQKIAFWTERAWEGGTLAHEASVAVEQRRGPRGGEASRA